MSPNPEWSRGSPRTPSKKHQVAQQSSASLHLSHQQLRESSDLVSPPMQPSTNHLRRTNNSWINLPIHFVSGTFEGQTIRAELSEIQKADLGRKYARVDRRPLDPPPVVLLKLYQVLDHGTEFEYEREFHNYSDIHTLGLLCCVDLFPVPNPDRDSPAPAQGHEPPQPHVSYHQPPLYHPQSHDDNLAAAQLPPRTISSRPGASHATLAPPSSRQPVLTYVWDNPITEDMKCTTALSGATFIQPSTIEYQGKKALAFAFADLAVKSEGQFFLRYRCFDILSRAPGHGDLPIHAECYGGVFKVYSTKEFPGLQASTELTKQLSRWGVRLNTRETERKRKRKDDHPFSSSVSRRAKGSGNKGSDSDYD
ncbi:velvet factor-domain-containing protein [Melanogaster broomeanus]|nr:velvet factor-domain-containing protein [Melanogaster broomeanus]